MALVPCQVLRVAILLSYCSILCNYKAIEMPSHQTYGGSWKFLTFIDLFVVAVFWIIYAYDREMIYPKLLDNFIPGWLNHGMGVLDTSCNWDVGVPFLGTHWPRSQNRLLWVYNHLNELFVPAGRSSEQLYLGYTEKASILASHIILPKLCKPCPKCM
ncbi:androgen-induced gene 1 protein isoform X9 [Canis lupus baileyi]|uniref:androgen-induced gene 1 protein isoform X10 n=1 Tax=Canis lupus dingo TaxID=286419 RepID=UPI0015F13517|nr:androgen-induced gene 1 protein isoform X10 [Canis lupus dingo]XP_038360671.1 androgen-induced gene 1 protein isoform X8 [Canis lupus familiaris]XP_038382143.1 androgen-induced gene 1 protein isoform X8 [Canis lupus familiaris]XP_038510263.1 androgen-induced gene 1 protein isoform X8 [Canis lupus familiaris]